MSQKPNVVLVYPDQMRFDCTSHNGNPVLKTPGFDRLAMNGASFQQAYTSFPICCPFRASLMTGKYAHNHEMMTNHYPLDLEKNTVFLPGLMKEGGYRTGWFGKWHLNGGTKFTAVPKDLRLGFDEFVGYSRGHNYLNGVFYRDDDPTAYKSRQYEPDYQTDHLIDFMERSLDDDQPFCGMICYGLPHTPVANSPEYYRTLFNPDEVPVADCTPPEGEEAARKFLAQYYGMVSCVDFQLQRITNWLQDKGILGNTIFVVVSDHGDMAGEHGMYMKNIYYDGAMHVPFIIHYPDLVNGNKEITQMVDPSVDIFATLLDLCDIEIPDVAQGHSLKTLLAEGADPALNEYVYYQLIKVNYDLCEHFEQSCRTPWGLRGLRTKDYLYVEREGTPFTMFDLKADPKERFNLVENGHNFDLLDTWHKRLNQVMEQVGDSWDKCVDHLASDYQPHSAGDNSLAEIYEKAVLV